MGTITPIVSDWQCSECSCTVPEAHEKRARLGMPPLTVRSTGCTPGCLERTRARVAESLRGPEQPKKAKAGRRAGRTPDGELYRFALNLRALRKKAGLTVRALARLAEVSVGYVSMMEAAKLRAVPSAAVRGRIAGALGTTPAKLGERVR